MILRVENPTDQKTSIFSLELTPKITFYWGSHTKFCWPLTPLTSHKVWSFFCVFLAAPLINLFASNKNVKTEINISISFIRFSHFTSVVFSFVHSFLLTSSQPVDSRPVGSERRRSIWKFELKISGEKMLLLTWRQERKGLKKGAQDYYGYSTAKKLSKTITLSDKKWSNAPRH